MTMTISLAEHDDAVVVAVRGDIDLLTTPRLRHTIDTALRRHPPILVIDLLAVRFLSTSALAVLIETQHRCDKRTHLRIVATGPATRRPLHLTGLDRHLALYPTRADALATTRHLATTR